ncbi:MAG: imidazole glycerol phosphate synthase subunit HisH [Endomicrobium sp.]|jgi:glutamine amidotransferase|nr:imidazole glycerol phosphate synthase subunit HisH [Endomicrobium sp.]
MAKQIKIAVIDYGFGNIKSVVNALNYCGVNAFVVDSPLKIFNFMGIILPGVGSFGPASDFLRLNGFHDAINDYVNLGRMIYGICLGFQLFFTKSYENGNKEGLGLISGEVKKFEFRNKLLKIPHIGWNNINIKSNLYANKMFFSINNSEKFYFVHSYYAVPNDFLYISSICEYGLEFCSSITYKNIWGSQFHPEKSGKVGLKILSNFINEVKK